MHRLGQERIGLEISVSLSADGNVLAVGATKGNTSGHVRGLRILNIIPAKEFRHCHIF